MASYFLDSSAIVKRYHFEPGSQWVRTVCSPRAQHTLYLAHIARVEVVAALRRTGVAENRHPSFIDSMINTFERHLALSAPSRSTPMYRILALSSGVLDLAADLCNRHWQTPPGPLRSLDAIHLASALAALAVIPEELTFVTADVRLAAIASLQGFPTLNPAYAVHP